MDRSLIASFILLFSALSAMAKPNIVFVLADDFGWRDAGAYGSSYYQTPNLDRLARGGMLFTDAYAASPLCSPTRASILTGQNPGRVRMTRPAAHLPRVSLEAEVPQNANPDDPATTPGTVTRLKNEYVTFAEILKEAGYATAFMGKWHLGRKPYLPENQGFDRTLGGRGFPAPPPPGYFGPWPDIETLPDVPPGTHIDDVLGDAAVEFIEESEDNPFLLCLWFYGVHGPYQAKEPLIEKYRLQQSPYDPQRNPIMAGMIETMDGNLGKVLDTLERMGLEEDTIVIFFSDNGGNRYDVVNGEYPTSNSPLRAGKGNNYEGGVRVPLIVKWPGVTEPGSVNPTVVQSTDLFPTLLDMAELPQRPELHKDGVDFTRALEGESYERAPIFAHFPHRVPATGNLWNTSVRAGPWKLYRFYHGGVDGSHRFELYNLKTDLGETHDLAASRPGKLRELDAKIDEFLEETDALVPAPNPQYHGRSVLQWSGNAETSLSAHDRNLRIELLGDTPEVHTSMLPSLSNAPATFEFEIRATASGNGTFAFTDRGENEDFDRTEQSFQVKKENDWQKKSFRFNVTSRIHQIRVQPLLDRQDATVEIRHLRLLSETGTVLRHFTFPE